MEELGTLVALMIVGWFGWIALGMLADMFANLFKRDKPKDHY